MKEFIVGVFLSVVLADSSAASGMNYDDYWKKAHHPGVEIREYPKETVVTDMKNVTVYIFTKPNNPAHPGVIVRKLVNGKDGSYFDTSGHSDGTDSAHDAFKAWMQNPLQ